MSARLVEVAGRKVSLLETGTGAPPSICTALPMCTAVEGISLPFHEQLAESARLIAPAHPGCSGTDD